MALNPSTHQPDTVQSADVAKTFTNSEIGSQIVLRTQSGYPTHAPQLLLLSNTDTSTAAAAVLTDRKGNSFTVNVPAASVVPVECGVLTIEASTTDTSTFSIVAFWWTDSSTEFQP